jgi:hypothetical protein
MTEKPKRTLDLDKTINALTEAVAAALVVAALAIYGFGDEFELAVLLMFTAIYLAL